MNFDNVISVNAVDQPLGQPLKASERPIIETAKGASARPRARAPFPQGPTTGHIHTHRRPPLWSSARPH